MSSFGLARALSDGTREASKFDCFCGFIDDGDNAINDTSKFVRLGCQCISHYHCLNHYIRSKLGDRLTMSLNGISCPYGGVCKSFKTLDEVAGDESQIYYINMIDLDNIVDYGLSHPELQQYLDENDYKPLTHEEVNNLRTWIDEQKNKSVEKFKDEDYDLFIISTTKACPHCGYRSTHYHGHQCHHISPARPPKRGGCPNCHINYCYKCLSTETENIRDRNSASNCRCGCWSNFCRPINSLSDINNYIATNDGGIPYDVRCGCVICSDCRYGSPCSFCSGDCCVCRGSVNPSPNEYQDTINQENKWIADGPALMAGTIIRDSLWDCCRHGLIDPLLPILERISAYDLNREDREGRSALFLAVDAGQTEVVRLLLAKDDLNVNGNRNYMDPPLKIACRRNHIEICRLLIAHPRIDPNINYRDSYTPLHVACDNGHVEVIQILLSHKDINVNKTVGGQSSLEIACRHSQAGLEMVGLLLHVSGIEMNGYVSGRRDRRNYFLTCYVPIITATNFGRTTICRLLVSQPGIDLNVLNSDGQSCLNAACAHGYHEIVRLYLSQPGIEVNSFDHQGRTPLSHACIRGDREVVEMLVAQPGVDPNFADFEGLTPLNRFIIITIIIITIIFILTVTIITIIIIIIITRCIKNKQAESSLIVQLLLSHPNINVNIPSNGYGWTPLIRSANNGLIEVTSILLDHPTTDISICDRGGATALAWATTKRHDHIIRMLEERNNDK